MKKLEPIEIPISSKNTHFEQENEVFGHSFIFEFEWAQKEDMWLLHIYDDTHTPLSLGNRLQTKWPLYTHKIGEKHITFMLMPTAPANILQKNNLKDSFTLVAYETV